MAKLETLGTAKANRSLNPFRPIQSREDALHARKSGAGIGIVLLIGYVLYTLLGLFGGRGLYGEALDATFYVSNAAAVILLSGLTFWVHRTGSLIGTSILALWFVVEVGLKVVAAPQTINFMTVLYIAIAVTCLVLAIRGQMVWSRLKKDPQPDAQVFD